MGVVRSIVQILGGNTEAQPLRFRCRACDHTFESVVRTMGKITCPKCGEGNIQRLVDEG